MVKLTFFKLARDKIILTEQERWQNQMSVKLVYDYNYIR